MYTERVLRGAAGRGGRVAPRLLTDQQMQRGSALKEPTERLEGGNLGLLYRSLWPEGPGRTAAPPK